MFALTLDELKLDEPGKIGYTFKTLGAGFWALRQNNFRRALTEIVMEVSILNFIGISLFVYIKGRGGYVGSLSFC